MRSIQSSILLTVLLLIPNVLWPCSCAYSTPQRSYEYASAVFSGRVLEVGIVTLSSGTRMYEVVFQVDQSWKEVTSEKVTVLTGLDESSCGYTFDLGNDYLVYATLWGDFPVASICSRTREISEASEDFSYFKSAAYMPMQNVPNPFRASGTMISFELPFPGHASLAVYDILGHEISRLALGYRDSGAYEMAWNGSDQLGKEAPSGLYFAVITSKWHRKSIRMLLLR